MTAHSAAILTVIAAAGLASVATFAFQHRSRPGARGFALAMFGAAAWSVVVAINIYPLQLLPTHVSMALRNGFILVICLGWLLFAVEYVRREQVTLVSWLTAGLLVIPVVTVLITVTNPLHHLAFGPGTPTDLGGGSEIEWGPWHLVFMTYAFFILFTPAGLLIRELRTARGPHRRQLLLILGGLGVGVVGANDYLVTASIDSIPSFIRFSPFVFLITATLWGIALFRYQLFGIVPVSRRTVVETIPDPVIAVDRNGLVIDLNPAARELFKLDSDITGTPLDEVCADYPGLVEQYRAGSENGELTIEDGSQSRYFSVTQEQVQEGNSGAVIVLREITSIRKREQQLQETNEQLDRFAGLVTHDLRNPLSVAQLSLEIAQDTDDEEMLDRVSNAHDRMEDMISSIRTLTHIDAEKLDYERVELHTTARQAWENVQTGGATLDVVSTTTVEADRGFVHHLFENLFRNAVEHGGDSVTVTVGTDEQGFYVADDGPGISPDERDLVFEHGYSSEGGTGFGLSIVKTVCDAHGWTVTITESDGGGTRFDITT